VSGSTGTTHTVYIIPRDRLVASTVNTSNDDEQDIIDDEVVLENHDEILETEEEVLDDENCLEDPPD